jgi:phage terminase large subunit
VLDESFLLSDEEFDALDPEEQQRYLDLLAEEQEDWALNPRQIEAERLADETDEFLFGGSAGPGKGLVESETVWTPFGPREIGGLKPGDQVSHPDGGVSRVIAVHHRGIQPCYRVEFSDGGSLVTDADHLWRYRLSGKRIKRSIDWKVCTTPQLAQFSAAAIKQASAERRPNWPLIPLSEPVNFNLTSRHPEARWPIDPYVLGVLLGDGCLTQTSVTFTSADAEIVEGVRRWAATRGWDVKKFAGKYAWGVVGVFRGRTKSELRLMLEELEIYGKRAEVKAVPERYKLTPIEMRRALVQGLMDTDGTVDPRGHASFSSASKQLALDLQWLLRSLGYKAKVSERPTGYRKDGVHVPCLTGYLVTISGRSALDLFRLERKRARCLEPTAPGQRRVTAVYRVPDQRTVCISVDHPDGMFVAGEDFVVTHNSEWLLYRADRLSREVPGHATLLLRSSFPELRRSLIRRSFTKLLYEDSRCGRPHWRAADKEWRYPNGAVIELGHCQSEDDVGIYLSAEYDMIGFDELTEFTEYQFDMIRSRARTTRAKKALGARPHVVGATNPGRRGHAWVKELFVRGTDYGDHIRVIETHLPTGETARRRVGYLPASVLDNPHIDPKYVEHLMSLPENLRRQYLEGDWDTFEGQYFPEFQKTKVELDGTVTPWHVIDPFPIPHEWPRFRAIDYGYAAPFACLWFAVDRDGYVYVYREAYETKLTPREQAIKVTKMSLCDTGGMIRPEKFDYTVADPSMWSNREGGLSIAAQYLQEKVQLRKGENDRIAGWGRVRDWLRADENGNPGVRVFSSCTNLIRTLPELVYDKNKPEDLDTTLEDHLCFVAGTLVQTATGAKPIETVVPGDMAWTRAGWAPVVAAGMSSGDAGVVRVRTEAGTVTCTPDHPLLLDTGEWAKAALLDPNDRIIAWDESLLPSGMDSRSALTRIVHTDPTTTSGATREPREQRASRHFIEPYGRRRTGRFQRAGTSTTSMGTSTTTTSRIWRLFRRAITPGSIRSTWRRLAALPPPGIGAKRGMSGMWIMADGYGRTVNLTLEPASVAALNSQRWHPTAMSDFVPTHASPSGAGTNASTTRHMSANAAAPPSRATSTTAPGFVAAHVLSVTALESRAAVYSLSVDGPLHEFVANGVVALNCDALRYGLMTRPRRFKPVISADSGEVGKLKRMLDRMGNRGKAKYHPDLGRMP